MYPFGEIEGIIQENASGFHIAWGLIAYKRSNRLLSERGGPSTLC